MHYVKLLWIVVLLSTILAANNTRSIYQKKFGNENKVALVIGNGEYTRFARLVNTLNDAEDIAKLLKEKNFDVIYVINGDLQSMEQGLKEFASKLKKGGVGFFYYAGHGLQINDSNYLIPINSTISNAIDVKYKSLPVNYVIDMMQNAHNRLNIIVLDACRNDPFKRGGGGLAQINNARGMYIAFATGPGQVASDGDERNGLFTKHLLRNINEPNISLDAVFNQTRQGVFTESHEEQLPWTSSSVIGDFYFNLVQENNPTKSDTPTTANENKTKESDVAKNDLEREIELEIEKELKRELEKKKLTQKRALNERFSTQNVQAFLEKSLKSEEGHDLYGILEYYDRKVEPYFNIPNATQDDIYNDKKSYFTQWSEREYKLNSVDIKRHYEYLDNFYGDISYKMSWSTANKERIKTGSSIISATLKSVGESFKITAISNISTTILSEKTLTSTKSNSRTITEVRGDTLDIDTTYQSSNTSRYPYVCYDRRIKQSEGRHITYLKYEGCKRYNQPCARLGKEHFGKYPNDYRAHKALIRCNSSRPRFVD
ncbi:MAG: caspase family protein [Campylobacterales bacterium]|nr:caspase family protein [Campylobacterales bacterium]